MDSLMNFGKCIRTQNFQDIFNLFGEFQSRNFKKLKDTIRILKNKPKKTNNETI